MSKVFISLCAAARVHRTVVNSRHLSDHVKDTQRVREQFDASLLDILVCPLSKKPLRYDENSKELVNDELGIAYPILDGIPNMIPQEARMIRRDREASQSPHV